ncbi:molybdopterin-dependent oxidoreductase [Bradyrhizobium sp. Leo121]|uniref:molybdopterin-dependent oxidoreductase n=1 Tax=Bradyrhizobium sp. Leo121 TaxID=1571195 RepID=UPI00102A62E1|nr:molybdopterin-dependent oxidoreductase [Bradyrhizobium sp. Leo121]RZN30292.1 oxidase [Bradyrhizobium sp. Leo121]
MRNDKEDALSQSLRNLHPVRSAATQRPSRRTVLQNIGIAGLSLAVSPALADEMVKLPFASGPRERPITHAFPQKGDMILQRVRPPLLETPLDVFDRGVFTPNDQFYVRWHWAEIPNSVDVNAFRLAVRGHVDRTLSLSITDILRDLPRVELAAVNQCSGNSRGFFSPRVPGAQWANGAMGNARWAGVRLKDVLDRAGVKAGAVQVRFKGLDEPVVPEAPTFRKSLAIDHARDGEVMIAYAMNGEQLPLLNGFPLRLIVPGWYSTYWIKMLSDIEVLDKPDDNYWMAVAYTIPDTPHASIAPGQSGVKMVPINRMVPRSFFTSITDGASFTAGTRVPLRGIAFGGDTGVAKVEFSSDGGKSWQPARLGDDFGKYGFRQWQTDVALADKGDHALMVRCTNSAGEVQPDEPNWNGSGFMRNVIETVQVKAV